MSRVFLLALVCLAWTGASLAAPQFPPLTGRVVDAANMLPPEVETRITDKLAALETATGRQVAVVTLPSLQGYEIEEFGYQLGRAWGIGSAERNDGALLIVAPQERRVRIEVGYGLEGVLTDALSNVILQERVLPKFRAGDMAAGVEGGADAIVAQLRLPDDEARAEVKAAARPEIAIDPDLIIFLVFVAVWILIVALRAHRFGRRARRGDDDLPLIIWGGGGSRGGGWSGGGGGGGWSGGGGTFGGGGSSGSW